MITGPDRKALRIAVLEAFAAHQLRQSLAESDPSRDFDRLTSPGAAYDQQIYQLIDRANDEGWLVQLLDTLLQERAENTTFVRTVAPVRARVQPAELSVPIEHEAAATVQMRELTRSKWPKWLLPIVSVVLLGGLALPLAMQLQQQIAAPGGKDAEAGAMQARLEQFQAQLEGLETQIRNASEQLAASGAPEGRAPEIIDAGGSPPGKLLTIEEMEKLISPDAANFTISVEHGPPVEMSAPYFTPGAGIVIGIGYSLGLRTLEQFRSEWAGQIPDAALKELEVAVGDTSDKASSLVPLLANISIPWLASVSVFLQWDLARVATAVQSQLPNTSELPPDSFGALVSLAFNRGPSFTRSGDRNAEMRRIRELMSERNFDAIPLQIRAMKRLWPTIPGLQQRREAEAALFEKGLIERAIAALK